MPKHIDFFLSTQDELQAALDAVGFVPFAGFVPDFTNGLISIFRGNPKEADLSALASIPIVGDFAIIPKKGVKAWNYIKKVFDNADFVKGTKHFLGEITGLFDDVVKDYLVLK